MTARETGRRAARTSQSAMATKLMGLGYLELFHRLTYDSLDKVWSEPGARKVLGTIARDAAAPQLAAFLAAEILFFKGGLFRAPDDRKHLAGVYAAALSQNMTQLTNAWGMPAELNGLAGQHFVQLGEAAVPDLARLLHDESPLTYSGSAEATHGNRYRYRVKDFAAFFISKIRGVQLAVSADPAARDVEIARLEAGLRLSKEKNRHAKRTKR